MILERLGEDGGVLVGIGEELRGLVRLSEVR